MKKFREIKGMFEGSIWTLSTRLAAPVILAELIQYIYIMIDTLFIAGIDRNSTHYLSGTGLVFPVFFLFIALEEGLFVGINSLISKAIGERNHQKIKNTAESGFVIALIFSLLAIIVGFFAQEVVNFLAGSKLSEQAIEAGRLYLIYLVPGICFSSFLKVLLGILQAEGLNKYMTIAFGIGAVINIFLDYVFIYILNLKTVGAAMATSIALFSALVFTIIVFLMNVSTIKIDGNLFKAKLKLIKEIMAIGIPHSIGMISLSVVFVVLNNLVSSISEAAMNSWSLVGRMSHLIFIVPGAVGAATVTMIGQNLGRQNFTRVKEIYLKNCLYVVCILCVIISLYIIFAKQLLSIFTDLPQVVDTAILQIRIISPPLILVAVSIVSGSALQAIGKPLFALFTTFLRAGVFSLPLIFLFSYFLEWGLVGIFWGDAVGNTLSAIFSFWITMVILKKNNLVLQGKKNYFLGLFLRVVFLTSLVFLSAAVFLTIVVFLIS